MRRPGNNSWKACLFALLVLHHHHHIDGSLASAPSSSSELEDDENGNNVSEDERSPPMHRHNNNDNNNNNKAIEPQLRDNSKQIEDGYQGKRNWKRWVKRLLLQEHIQNFVLLDGLLTHAWRGRNNRKGRMSPVRESAMLYLENDDRRARTFALEDASSSSRGANGEDDMALGSTSNAAMMMAPLQYEDFEFDKIFSGMILQIDYAMVGREGSFYQNFQEKLQIPICKDLETASRALYAIDTYQLLEPLHLELGLSAQHAIDFAYTPVELAGASRRHYRHDYHSPAALVDRRAHYTGPPTFHQPSWWNWWFPLGIKNSFWKDEDEEYRMSDSAFQGGSHGEVWRGRRLCRDEPNSHRRRIQTNDPFEQVCTESHSLIFKRLKIEHGYRLLEAGLREVYLGKLLAEEQGAAGLFTTYINHFFREVPKRSTTHDPWTEGENDLELWIVFQDAGPSLRSFLYSQVDQGDFTVSQHSLFWTRLRQNAAAQSTIQKDRDNSSLSMIMSDDDDEIFGSNEGEASNNTIVNGKEIMKEVLRQILTSAAYLHDRGIVHRDIKPGNCMCKSNFDLDTLAIKGDAKEMRIRCVLGDFSSAWDRYTHQNLYTNGPSIEELTIEYAPPEATLGSPWDSFSKKRPHTYDSWSIGVLALELLLGTPNVFSVDQRTTALLTHKMTLKGASEKEIKRALYLAALSQFCIYMPSSDNGSKKQKLSWPLRQGDPLYKIAMVKESCTLRDFHQALRARDPLGLGFDKSADQLLHLIWQLLAWDPLERISASEALKHPYFVSNSTSELVPGEHNALESQMLDPRMDFNLSDNVDEFMCPKCGRTFRDWKSCHKHANARNHAKFCTYDRSKLPSSVNAHSMLPAHPKSGYFDIQGRRKTIEDFHSIHLLPSTQFYGVFDGHTGNLASKYAASALYEQLKNRLSHVDDEIRNGTTNWKESAEKNITEAFDDIHRQFLKAVTFAGHGAMDNSGTTATAVYVTNEAVVVASLGDSRAILSSLSPVSDKQNQRRTPIDMSAIQLTKDHVASDTDEANVVKKLGGNVTVVNGLARVNGVLAITRSIGDAPFANVLSRTPHVISMTRQEVRELCGVKKQKETDGGEEPCFIILASDGLWDVVNNDDAVNIVAQTIRSYQSNSTKHDAGAYQEASEVLTLEAYVRGSTDNIGVCVISLN